MLRFQYLLPALSVLAPSLAAAAERPQMVIVSFDGAHDNALWDRSRALAGRTGAHFTYFLSCTFLMNADAKKAYQAPGQKKGRSNVGFARSEGEIRTRLNHLWAAHLEGHEIGSHGCGHFDGKDWTKADWAQEFRTFRTTLANAWKGAGAADREPAQWQDFARNGIHGFRAPYLAAGKPLVDAEREDGLTYDASLVTRGPMLPREQDGIIHFGLPLIPEGPAAKPVVAMDYNLFVRHSVGIENKARSAEFEERALAAYRAAFEAQYTGQRIPLQLGFHFVEMNGGAYWRALDRFVTEVCGKPDVACVTYSQAIEKLHPAKGESAAGTSAF